MYNYPVRTAEFVADCGARPHLINESKRSGKLKASVVKVANLANVIVSYYHIPTGQVI